MEPTRVKLAEAAAPGRPGAPAVARVTVTLVSDSDGPTGSPAAGPAAPCQCLRVSDDSRRPGLDRASGTARVGLLT